MTVEQLENLVKSALDAGLKITTAANEDGSATVKISTSFTVAASATEGDVRSAVKQHLNTAQVVFHNLATYL